MLQSLVVGLGRAGAGLHLRVLAQARATAGELFHPGPVVACDPAPEARGERPGVTVVESVRAAAALLPPEDTVVHLCTPPVDRAALLGELGDLGFRRIIVEKPLATGLDEYAAVRRACDEHGLAPAVVTHWLDAELTHRLQALTMRRAFGDLRSISVTQDKPRFQRSTLDEGHPTAFDVEIPHALGVVLRLAGPAELLDAKWTDMRSEDFTLPRMGGARLVLRHRGGVLSEISSDLTAPVRERRISLDFERGRATGHFPLSEHDDHAQLTTTGDRVRRVFRDDALTAFVLRAYRHFLHPDPRPDGTFALHGEILRLIAAAKQHCLTALPDLHRRHQHAG